jgi:hypothetical protein
LARITASKALSDLAAGLGRGPCLLLSAPAAGTLTFGSLSSMQNALSAHETMSGNEPARISDAASAAVESDLKRATMSEGSGSRMDRTPGVTLLWFFNPVFAQWLQSAQLPAREPSPLPLCQPFIPTAPLIEVPRRALNSVGSKAR